MWKTQIFIKQSKSSTALENCGMHRICFVNTNQFILCMRKSGLRLIDDENFDKLLQTLKAPTWENIMTLS